MIVNVMDLRRREQELHAENQKIIVDNLTKYLRDSGFILCNAYGQAVENPEIDDSLFFLMKTDPISDATKPHRHPFVGHLIGLNRKNWTLELFGYTYITQMKALSDLLERDFNVIVHPGLIWGPGDRFQSFPGEGHM